MNLYMRYLLCQYTHLKLLGLITDNACGNNVSNVDNSSGNTKYSVKMPCLCMLCKMCDVRVCIGLVVFVTVAFIAVIVTNGYC